MFARLFLDHPQSVGENYFEHQRVALSFVGPLLFAGFACLLHAFVPGLCGDHGQPPDRKAAWPLWS